jgi:hypothetical protein
MASATTGTGQERVLHFHYAPGVGVIRELFPDSGKNYAARVDEHTLAIYPDRLTPEALAKGRCQVYMGTPYDQEVVTIRLSSAYQQTLDGSKRSLKESITSVNPQMIVKKAFGDQYRALYEKYQKAHTEFAEFIKCCKQFKLSSKHPDVKFAQYYEQDNPVPRDLTFLLKDGIVSAHQFVIQSKCAKIFKNQFGNKQINLPANTKAAMNAFLEYVYTGSTKITDPAIGKEVHELTQTCEMEELADLTSVLDMEADLIASSANLVTVEQFVAELEGKTPNEMAEIFEKTAAQLEDNFHRYLEKPINPKFIDKDAIGK